MSKSKDGRYGVYNFSSNTCFYNLLHIHSFLIFCLGSHWNVQHHSKTSFTTETFNLHSHTAFFRIKSKYNDAYKSVNAVQNVLMWRTSASRRLTLFSLALIQSCQQGIFTLHQKKKKRKGFLLKMSENEFLGRHNKTAYYITNRMHLQESSPRREKNVLGTQRAEFCHRKMPYQMSTKTYSHRYRKRLLVYTRGYNNLCYSTNKMGSDFNVSVETSCIHFIKEILVSPRDLSTYVSVMTYQTLGGHV